MKRIWFIRHGESQSNAGERTEAPHSTGLTDKGHRQAQKLAESWWVHQGPEPDLIVTSPYLRTQVTAGPLASKYPKAKREEWPVHEFTQLVPGNWKGTTHAERLPKVLAYWDKAEPAAVDGDGADSFDGFLSRIARAMHRAAMETDAENIAIFSHNHCVHAAIWIALGHLTLPAEPEDMRRFYAFSRGIRVANTSVLPLWWTPSGWAIWPMCWPEED